MEPNYVELAQGAYRDAIALAMIGRVDEANAQIRNANNYVARALASVNARVDS